MNIDNFIKWISNLYKEIYGEKIRYPSFLEANSFHHESMMRMGIEARFFKIENDIDQLLKLAHLDYLHHHYLLVDTISLMKRFNEQRCDVVYQSIFRVNQVELNNETYKAIMDKKLISLNIKPINQKFISTSVG